MSLNLTADKCRNKYGEPGSNAFYGNMMFWDLPEDIKEALPTVPARIYINKDLQKPLQHAFMNLIIRGVASELRTWDGCFDIRKQFGSYKNQSIHSWGIAIDMNAAWNQVGATPTFSPVFVQCFIDAGFDWTGYEKRANGMHFQLKKI